MIEITFSPLDAGAIHVAGSKSQLLIDEAESYGIPEIKALSRIGEIVYLTFHWDIGYLHDDETSDYRMELPVRIWGSDLIRFHPEEIEDISEEGKLNNEFIKKIIKHAKNGDFFRIWLGRSAEELCGYYYICHLLKDYDVSVSLMEVPQSIHAGDRTYITTGWGAIPSCTIGFYENVEEKIDREQIIYLAGLWDQLVRDDSPLRTVIGGNVIGVPEDFFDDLILKFCPDGDEVIEAKWIEHIIAHAGNLTEYAYLRQRLWVLQEKGIVKNIKDGENMRDRVWRRIR